MTTILGYPTLEPIRASLIGHDGKAVEFDAGSINLNCQKLTADDHEDPEAPHFPAVRIQVTATLRRFPRKDKVKLLQLAGILRAPRFTYRTNVALVNRRRYNGHRRPAK